MKLEIRKTLKMSLLNKIVFLLSFCSLTPLLAQNTYFLNGKIQNTEGESLAFVAVLPNGDVTKGVLSDIDGRFTISSKAPILSLTFRCIGLQTLRLDADFLQSALMPLSIILKKADNLIPEVTIAAGENPADILIRRVVAHKNRNNPEKLATFQCKTYNKVAVETVLNDSSFRQFVSKKDSSKKGVKNAEQNFKNQSAENAEHQLLMLETVTERQFRFPNDNFERVLLNRVSGFPNTGVVALANMIQPFSFYADFLTILDKSYTNPISIGSPSLYFFNIEDTLYQGRDTVFIISFHPRKGKVFESLTGVLHINSREWAVQNVQAKPTNPSQLTLKIEQQYRFDTTAAQWFPDQLNFELEFPKYPFPWMGARIVGRSYISDVSINPPLKQKNFNPETPLIIEKSAFGQSDSVWLPFRAIAPLSMRELRTYEWLDSISKKKNFNFWSDIMTALASGKFPIKKSGISLNISRLLSMNNYEGTRLGLGLTTAESSGFSRPKVCESAIYAGYGLRDSAWKYGGYLKFRLAQAYQTTWQLGYIHDLREPGSLPELAPTGLVSRSLYANRFDTNDELSAIFSSRINKRMTIRLTGQQQFLKPNYAYHFQKSNGDWATNFNFTELSVYAKYVFDEPNTVILGEALNEINRIPVVEMSYTRGFDLKSNLLPLRGTHQSGGAFSYEKWLFAVHQTHIIRRLGRMTWRIEGGIVNGNVPFAKLFTLNQSGGRGGFTFYVPNTFQTINDTAVWLSDRFLNIYFSQSLGHVLYRAKRSAPQLSIAQNMAFGTLSNPTAHSDITFLIPSKPLIESGLILDNLLKINYLNFGDIGLGTVLFYRWGTNISSWRSLNPRVNLRFSL